MSANRILVHSGVATDFRDRFCRKVFDLTNGDPAEAATVIGPLINARQVAALEKKVDAGWRAGAKALVRGETVGNVMAPVVLENVDRESAIAHDELFGPVVLLMEFGDDQEAIDIANDTDFGLSGAVHTRDISRGIRIARQIHTGMVHVNDRTVFDLPGILTGGMGSSGSGSRFGSTTNWDEFTEWQWVTVGAVPVRYPF